MTDTDTLSREQVYWIQACLTDGSYTKQEQREFNTLCRMALRSLDAEAVREACAKVCDEIRNSARRDYERHLATNGGKFRYGSGDPANFSSAREADFSMAAARIRALDLGQINAATQDAKPLGAEVNLPAVAAPDPQEGEVAGAAPDVRELVRRLLAYANESFGGRLEDDLRWAAAQLSQPAAAGVSEEKMLTCEKCGADLVLCCPTCLFPQPANWPVPAPVIYHCPEYYDGALVRLEDYDKLRHSLAERADRVSVPREPTDEMTEAFWRDYSVGERFVEGYRAMLSARPKE